MVSKFVTLEYEEYLSVYRYWKQKINPSNYTTFPWNMLWKNMGLEYYDSLAESKRRFKIIDHSKWNQHWMLVKINN